jgi:hypothetical protein
LKAATGLQGVVVRCCFCCCFCCVVVHGRARLFWNVALALVLARRV